MRAGLLTERLTFLGSTSVKSDTGAIKKEWASVYSCKAYKHKTSILSDRDGLNAKEVFNGYNLVFQVRYNPVLDESQRVEYMGKLYKIIPPLDYQRDNTYILTVTRVDE
jgi:SPP1 family predicted phage head-tail adaptor